MARDMTEVETLPLGMDINHPQKGSFLQNLIRREAAWHVRGGLGQLAQYDTTLSRHDSLLNDFGYIEHLGSHPMRTDFGHIHIVTVHLARVFTGNQDAQGIWTRIYTVSIYDVTADTRHEEVLYKHTAEINPDIFTMPSWRAQFETARDEDHQDWFRADDKQFFFTEFIDTLFFGSTTAGLWAYTPAIFNRQARKQVDSVNNHQWAFPRAENSLIVRVAPADGDAAVAFTYLNSGTFPSSPAHVANLDGRLAIADGRTVWFSDRGRPASVIAHNNIDTSTEQNVTVMVEIHGNLLIFTESETLVYQPNVGDIINEGRLTKLSQDIGCIGPSTVVRAGDKIVWMDRNGVYESQGLLGIKRVSDAIDPFFVSAVSNPLTSWYVNSGATDLTQHQPRLAYDMRDIKAINMAFDPSNELLLISIPAHNIIWAKQSDSWHIWNMEATVAGTAGSPADRIVGAQQNITGVWPLAIDGRVFMVGGVESYKMTDATLAGGVPGTPLDEDIQPQSYYILELDRGGALDRSVDLPEDRRGISGQYRLIEVSGGSPSNFYIDEPVILPAGYTWPGGRVVNQETYLFPMYLQVDPANPFPEHFDLIFRFDNTTWEPVRRPGAATTSLEVELAPERAASSAGWSIGAGLGPTSEAQVYSSATGLAVAGGDQIRLRWDGATYMPAGAPAGEYGPQWNMNVRHRNPVIMIGFTKLNPATTSNISLGLALTTLQYMDGANTVEPNLYWWEQPYINNRHDADDIVQPVEWVIKSLPIALKQGAQVQTRGQYLTLKSAGDGATQFWPDNRWGVLNQLVAPDFKGWSSQIVDFSGAIHDVADHPSTRLRMRDGTTATAEPKVYNDFATWGDSLVPTAGNYLVDDQAVDTIAVSKKARGESFTWMSFGVLRNRAERLVVESIKTAFKVVGGRRRRGRGNR